MLVCGCANLLNSLGCQAELVLGLLQRFGVKGLLQVRVIVYFIVFTSVLSFENCIRCFSSSMLQLDGKLQDNSWGVFDKEEVRSEKPQHLSLSLDSTFNHCRMERETDAELVHRDLSTALLLQLICQKGLLSLETKMIEEDTKVKLGRLLWQLQACLKCNTHGVGERVVQEHEDGQVSFICLYFTLAFHMLG